MNLESLLSYLPNRFSPETSLRWLFISISLALAAIAWLGIAHGQRRLANLQLAMSQRESLLNEHDQLQLQTNLLEQQVRSVQSDCDILIAKLPTVPAESEFLTLLSDSATQFGVTLGDFRPGSVQSISTARQMELRLRATGAYTGLCKWLDHMTQLPRLIHVHHLTLIGPATSGGDCSVDLQLVIVFGFSDEVH